MVDDPAARNAVLSVGSIQPARIDLRYTLRMVEDKVRLHDDYYVMLSRRWQIKSLKLGTAMKGNQIGNLRRQVKRIFFLPVAGIKQEKEDIRTKRPQCKDLTRCSETKVSSDD